MNKQYPENLRQTRQELPLKDDNAPRSNDRIFNDYYFSRVVLSFSDHNYLCFNATECFLFFFFFWTFLFFQCLWLWLCWKGSLVMFLFFFFFPVSSFCSGFPFSEILDFSEILGIWYIFSNNSFQFLSARIPNAPLSPSTLCSSREITFPSATLIYR